jgi:hypothetical protein
MHRTHNAFHVSRLRPYLTTTAFPARAEKQAIPETQLVQNEEHFQVSSFCGHRLVGKGGLHLQFLVQFTGVNQKDWSFAADLSRPPGFDQRSYLEFLSTYVATNPRGAGPKGRPPRQPLTGQLQQRLQAELERATWAASQLDLEESPSRRDTDRVEDPPPDPPPPAPVQAPVALFRGGEGSADQQAHLPLPQNKLLFQPHQRW